MDKNWSAWRIANWNFFNKNLENLPRTKRLLDLGSGPEQFENIFRQFNYKGIDFKNFRNDTVIADLTKDLPLPNSTADIITLSNVVEHIPNTDHLFKECRRLLKNGGLIIGTIPFLLGVHQAPYDFNRYTHYQLKLFLENNGFSDISIKPLGAQIDVYNNIELKVFDELKKVHNGITLKLIRSIRRTEMKIINWLYSTVPAGDRLHQGYGFTAKAI